MLDIAVKVGGILLLLTVHGLIWYWGFYVGYYHNPDKPEQKKH